MAAVSTARERPLARRGRPMKTLTAGFLCLLAVLAACGGRQDASVGERAVQNESCRSIKEIGSYRYSLSLKVDLREPAGQGVDGATPSAPLSAFADALTALFSDFTLEGAYIPPDRAQAILRFKNEEIELRAIGDITWVRVGTTWTAEETTDAQLLTPVVVCESIVSKILPALSRSSATPQTLRGVQTLHYQLQEGDIEGFAEVLGGSLPERYTVNLWLAAEGNWPVQLEIQSQAPEGDEISTSFELSMAIRDLNDTGIRIEPPVVASPVGSPANER
jgi:hypothetical protein